MLAEHTHIDDSCRSHFLFELYDVLYIPRLGAAEQVRDDFVIIQPSVVVVLVWISILPAHGFLHFVIVSI